MSTFCQLPSVFKIKGQRKGLTKHHWEIAAVQRPLFFETLWSFSTSGTRSCSWNTYEVEEIGVAIFEAGPVCLGTGVTHSGQAWNCLAFILQLLRGRGLTPGAASGSRHNRTGHHFHDHGGDYWRKAKETTSTGWAPHNSVIGHFLGSRDLRRGEGKRNHR